MNPNHKGARCHCGARFVAVKCCICGGYFYMCMDALDSCPVDEEDLDCSFGGGGGCQE